MRRLLAAMLLCTAAQAAAYTVPRGAAYVAPPPASAADLTRAERMAEQANKRLRAPVRPRASGWAYGSPNSR